ncbi:MAG: succinate dehydrogenase, cytochrome b556 subunit [Usitatibacter sp.]
MTMATAPKSRPKYYEFNLLHHWAPAVLSIFHRISGALLFFPILPVLLYLLHVTLGSPEGYARWQEFFARPVVKLILIGVVWLYAHHFWAGLRYLVLDVHWGVAKAPARASAFLVFALGFVTMALAAWRLW